MTERLVELIRNSETPPSVLISGSATGYYGDLGEVVVTEEEPPHNEFTHKLCAQWERIACGAQSDNTRVCLLRTGVVLARKAVFSVKCCRRLKWGLAGPSETVVSIWRGSISTIWSTVFSGCWITTCAGRLTWCLRIRYVMNNLLMPGHALHRPAVLRVPATAIRLLMGESSVLVLGGQRALPNGWKRPGLRSAGMTGRGAGDVVQ